MSSTTHPSSDLSAYLDGALGAAERARVAAHLDGCAGCRRHLAELRATASLISRLADPMPTRSLLPKVARAPAWLAPLRTLSVLASGLSVLALVASVLLGAAGQASRAGGTAALQASAAPAPNAAGAPLAPDATAAPAARQDAAKETQPSPAVGFGAAVPASPAASGPLANARTSQGADTARDERTAWSPAVPSDPWLWLAAALITGALAMVMERRLRRS